MLRYLLDLVKIHWGLLVGLLTTIATIIGAYITWRQYKTNKNKLKFEMYDKKYAIYKSLQEFIAQIAATGTVDLTKMSTCIRETRESEFFFEDDIEKYLKEIFNKAIKLCSVHAAYSPLPARNERSKLVDEERELLDWFTIQPQVASSKFAKYLKLTDLL